MTNATRGRSWITLGILLIVGAATAIAFAAPAGGGRRFRTRGRHSAATVRGTFWETSDRCDGTLTRVRRGRVVVRDFRLRRNVLVRAGRSYLARAPTP